MKWLIVTASAMLLSSCGSGEQTVTYKDSEGTERSLDVKESGDTRTVVSADGVMSATGTKGGTNARFPAFAPQYPGATVQAAVDMNVAGIKQHIITQITADSAEAALAFYKEKAGAAGKRIQEMGSGPGKMLVIGGTGLMDMEGSITAMAVSGGTSVNVTTQERK